jgi:predicted ArsR family transcriptional regulator
MTEAQLLEALRAAALSAPEDEDAMLCAEIAEALGLSIPQTSRYIRQLVQRGVVECVRRRVPSVTGHSRPQPAYRLARRAA